MADPYGGAYQPLLDAYGAANGVDPGLLRFQWGQQDASRAASVLIYLEPGPANGGLDSTIHSLHTPFLRAAVPGVHSPIDNLVMGVVTGDGDDSLTVPDLVQVPGSTFDPVGPITVADLATWEPDITAPIGAAYSAPAGAPGDANTDQVTVRRAMIVPPALMQAVLEEPTYTGKALAAKLLPLMHAHLTSRGEAFPGQFTQLVDWLRVASTLTTVGGGGGATASPAVALPAPLGPPTTPAARTLARKELQVLLERQFPGRFSGPPPPTVADPAVLNHMQTSNHIQQRLLAEQAAYRADSVAQEERRRAEQQKKETFSYKFRVFASTLHAALGTATDADLPEVYQDLAKSGSNMSRLVVQSAFNARTRAADSAADRGGHAPELSASQLLDLRYFNFTNPTVDNLAGLMVGPLGTLVAGLKDHQSHDEAAKNLALLLETSDNPNASDIEKYKVAGGAVFLTASPWTYVQMWRADSVATDVLLGPAHPFAEYYRTWTDATAPTVMEYFMRPENNSPEKYLPALQGLGVMICIVKRQWLNTAFDGTGGPKPVPEVDFQHISGLVRRQEYNSFPPLPERYVKKKTTPAKNVSFKENAEPNSRGSPRSGRNQGSPPRDSPTRSLPVINHMPHDTLVKRWEKNKLPNFKELIDKFTDKGVDLPKVSGQDICFAWHLGKNCKSHCPRKAAHCELATPFIAQVHKALDDAGFPPN